MASIPVDTDRLRQHIHRTTSGSVNRQSSSTAAGDLGQASPSTHLRLQEQPIQQSRRLATQIRQRQLDGSPDPKWKPISLPPVQHPIERKQQPPFVESDDQQQPSSLISDQQGDRRLFFSVSAHLRLQQIRRP
ncbi:hypothetical protein ACLOJK_015218 [Asimina triloba]